MRAASVQRKTKETEIFVALEIDGQGTYDVETPIGFLTHMLETFARHGLFDLTMRARGDLEVDQHHLLEDCGIVLGQAFKQALGDRSAINRAGYFVYPMDEALAVVAVDIGGRPYLQYETRFERRFCGELDTDLLEDFYHGFAIHLGANLAVRMPYGRSDHHRCEAAFKAFARAMKMACSKEPREVQGVVSTKGVMD